MERRVRWKSHARCESGENPEIVSKDYLSLYSGRGDGFEAFYHYKGGLSKDLAENIETEVLKIGQNSRGCKTKLNSSGKDYYAFIRETICPAVICEGFFVDNETDVQIADSLEEQKAFGIAYAKGILKTLGISIKENSSQPESDKKAKYFVQVGAYSKRENAENQLQNAKNAGFSNAFMRLT